MISWPSCHGDMFEDQIYSFLSIYKSIYVYISIYLYIYQSVNLSIYAKDWMMETVAVEISSRIKLKNYLLFYPSINLYIYIHIYIYLSIYLSIYAKDWMMETVAIEIHILTKYLLFYPSINLYILYIYLSICLSMRRSGWGRRWRWGYLRGPTRWRSPLLGRGQYIAFITRPRRGFWNIREKAQGSIILLPPPLLRKKSCYMNYKQCFGSVSFWCGSGSADPLPGWRIRIWARFWIRIRPKI